jgi:hypothetical protein
MIVLSTRRTKSHNCTEGGVGRYGVTGSGVEWRRHEDDAFRYEMRCGHEARCCAERVAEVPELPGVSTCPPRRSATSAVNSW